MHSLIWIYQLLRTGWYLLIKLFDFNQIYVQIKCSYNGRLNHCEEFAAPDPFEFVLASRYYDEEKYLHWDKHSYREKMVLNRNLIIFWSPTLEMRLKICWKHTTFIL